MQTGSNRGLWVRDALPFVDRQPYRNFLERMTYDFHRYIDSQPSTRRGWIRLTATGSSPSCRSQRKMEARAEWRCGTHAPPVTRNSATRNWEEHVERMVAIIPSRVADVRILRKRIREDEEMVAVVRRAKCAKTEKVPSSVTGRRVATKAVTTPNMPLTQKQAPWLLRSPDFYRRSRPQNCSSPLPEWSSVHAETWSGQSFAARSPRPRRNRHGKGKPSQLGESLLREKQVLSRRGVKKSHDAIGKPSSNLYPFLQQPSVLQLEREVMELASERDSPGIAAAEAVRHPCSTAKYSARDAGILEVDAVDVTQKWPEPCKQSHEAELRVGNGTWLSKLVSLLRRVVVHTGGGDPGYRVRSSASIVMGWMDWLTDRLDKREKQGWFPHAIVSTLAEEVVTIGHPICDPDSQKRQLYEIYVQLYRGEIETSEVVLAPTDDRWAQFVDMLLTALCYVRDPARRQPPTDVPKPKFYQLLLEDSDFYLPPHPREWT
ncbi:hypothetical protein DFP72DRAFT_1107038 [Ephemerocybe angulata]|uniref:Uncharacterized protein n=1 Tax=Ephemerocybe angulata TaxID=980116 RepID=A0A8H6I5R3_9AGAR|nr:hypothetical protein DFP72DRAFT_1107038 [Tulosesus angulatus]